MVKYDTYGWVQQRHYSYGGFISNLATGSWMVPKQFYLCLWCKVMHDSILLQGQLFVRKVGYNIEIVDWIIAQYRRALQILILGGSKANKPIHEESVTKMQFNQCLQVLCFSLGINDIASSTGNKKILLFWES